MKKYILDEKLGTELLNYLAGRPYVEVYQFVSRVQTLPEYKEPVIKEEKVVKDVSK